MIMPFEFPVQDWGRCFSRNAYNHGLDYAADGRVIELRAIDGTGCNWAGKVKGSGRNLYACNARLIPSRGRGKPRLVSQCSCPVGAACKHVAALIGSAQRAVARGGDAAAKPLKVAATSVSAQMLEETIEKAAAEHRSKPKAIGVAEAMPALGPGRAVLEVRPAFVPDPLHAWREWLARTEAPSAPPVEVAEHIGVMVRASEYGEIPDLLAALVHFRAGQKGQRVDPKNVAMAVHGPKPEPAGGWTDQDVTAATLLIDRQSGRIGTLYYTVIRGRVLEQALLHLLSHYPAFLEKGVMPLAAGPDRRLRLQWLDQVDGSQRLGCVCEDGQVPTLLRGESLWYVDTDRRLLGRVDGGMALLEQARSAPTLAPEESQALRELLRRANASLPLPEARALPRQMQAPPVPVLHLRQLRPSVSAYNSGDSSRYFALAQVHFEYHGVRMPRTGPASVRRMVAGELLEIVRDSAAEERWLRRFNELSLMHAASSPWPWTYAFSAAPDAFLLMAGKPPRPLPPEGWHDTLLALAGAGVKLEYETGFPKPLRDVDAGELDAELSPSGNAWFDLSLGVDIEGRRVDLLPILHRVLADPAFPLIPPRGEPSGAKWRIELDNECALRLPLVKLRTLIAPLLEWLQGGAPLRVHRSQGALVDAIGGPVRWRGDEALRSRLINLSQRPPAADAPVGFLATLRPYQREGLAWLNLLGQAGLGGVLADDMGLGKTVQVLAHLLCERQRHVRGFRALVVAPTSLMGNWRDEAERYAPTLKSLVLQGPDRAGRYQDIEAHDLVLTTYPLLGRDRERLIEHEFDLLVLDEAQAIKNARGVAAQVVRELRAQRRLAMTGTPLENHLGELWAQFDAVEPGLLGSEREFVRLYRTPIEKHGDADRQQRLNRRIGPLLLRRRKDEVMRDLPPKTEIVRHLEIEGGQRELYESLRLAQHERVREAIAQRGLAQSGIVVLDALLKLRQCCCDPRLLKLPAARKVKDSAKLDALLELLATLRDEGRRVLLFSQFTGMLDLIEPALDKLGLTYLRLDGDTPGEDRLGIVRAFQKGEAQLFLISLKAGGVGLNLTAADTVIHYDPWWNPAVENQATDRAHRIGQDKPVFVYKLICASTVEDKILALQQRKADLAKAVLEGGRSTSPRFTEADLSELFAPLR